MTIPDKSLFKLQAEVCKALGNPVRIEVIDLLCGKELTFGEIVKKTGYPKSNLSQHLSVMVNKGILLQRRNGVNVYFKLASKKVYSACCTMRGVLLEKLKKENEIFKKLTDK
ncbi:MAG: winged helix-turn-helix transcriptional regulator [Bacteroidetes bacterium]|nr:winged helix-turn-helix transcriptional regulator [Bacteroidota bacterium]